MTSFDISKELLNSAIRSSDFNKQFDLSLDISSRVAKAFDWLRNFIPETAEQFELTVIDNNPTLTPIESEINQPYTSGRILPREYIQQQANAELVTEAVSAAYIELKNFLDTRAPYDAQICQLHDWDEYLRILDDKFLGIEKVIGGLR